MFPDPPIFLAPDRLNYVHRWLSSWTRHLLQNSLKAVTILQRPVKEKPFGDRRVQGGHLALLIYILVSEMYISIHMNSVSNVSLPN